MSIFGKLFGGKEGAAEAAKAAAAQTPAPITNQPGRTISYDPTLIESLLHDHRQLNACYERIGGLLQNDKFGEVRDELIDFKTRLQAHILSENVRFYSYLEQSLEGDASNLETLHDVRREMNGITRGVMDFVKKYQLPDVLNNETQADFANDYQAVGKQLTQRLQREESSLYPLYQPS
ncbi:MAG: hemerythrin domain-containing protein [Rhodanobacter sp.]